MKQVNNNTENQLDCLAKEAVKALIDWKIKLLEDELDHLLDNSKNSEFDKYSERDLNYELNVLSDIKLFTLQGDRDLTTSISHRLIVALTELLDIHF